MLDEVVQVARAQSVDLPEDYADDRLAFVDTVPATMTSSMHRDLERGNRLEVAWLSGDVVDRGQALRRADARQPHASPTCSPIHANGTLIP